MALLLKRNTTIDPWFSLHGMKIFAGEVVILDGIENEQGRTSKYPSEIYVRRRRDRGDKLIYKASLSCYDYVGTTKKPHTGAFS